MIIGTPEWHLEHTFRPDQVKTAIEILKSHVPHRGNKVTKISEACGLSPRWALRLCNYIEVAAKSAEDKCDYEWVFGLRSFFRKPEHREALRRLESRAQNLAD